MSIKTTSPSTPFSSLPFELRPKTFTGLVERSETNRLRDSFLLLTMVSITGIAVSSLGIPGGLLRGECRFSLLVCGSWSVAVFFVLSVAIALLGLLVVFVGL